MEEYGKGLRHESLKWERKERRERREKGKGYGRGGGD